MKLTDQPLRQGSQRSTMEFVDVDARSTSKAWTRFLAIRKAPSLPMTGVRSVIYQSWVRSNSTGIKPEQFAAPSLERGTSIAKSTYDHSELRRATRASMEQIGDLLTHSEAMLILTDRNGVILETVGDNATLSKAHRINLSVGGVWSEDASGTNGIGTALWTGKPTYVHGEEHFCEGMKAWSCAAAPIHDPIDNSIIGVINLSGLTSIFQKHNAAFAATAARDIELAMAQEQALLKNRLMEAAIVRFPSHALAAGGGLVILDRFGRLIFNRDSGLIMGPNDKGTGPQTRFLDLADELSEENILAALPADHGCDEIELITVDGVTKGAALVFRPAARPRKTIAVFALPSIAISGSNLKIVGESEAILEALEVAKRIGTVETPTLIEGETGVGKDLFARLICSNSDPGIAPRFTALNCAAMTPESIAKVLPKPSAEERAAPLYLDEIGELPADMQPVLLRMLEERLTGLTGPDDGDVVPRILSLTNRVMLDEVNAGRFRRDLFYRLGTVILRIPPLRDRGEDILLIAEHYNRKISAETGRDLLVLGSDVQEALMVHRWPGNVRELRNVVSSLHYLAKSPKVTLADLPSEVTQPSLPNTLSDDTIAEHETQKSKDISLKQSEISLIENALLHHHGNISKAAVALGISRPTLYRKIHSFGRH